MVCWRELEKHVKPKLQRGGQANRKDEWVNRGAHGARPCLLHNLIDSYIVVLFDSVEDRRRGAA